MDSVGLSQAECGPRTRHHHDNGVDGRSTGPHARFRASVSCSNPRWASRTSRRGRGAPWWARASPTPTGSRRTWRSSLIAAIEHRDRTGEGVSIDLSQLEACIWGLDAEVLRLRWAATNAPRSGTATKRCPARRLPRRRRDQWLALAGPGRHRLARPTVLGRSASAAELGPGRPRKRGLHHGAIGAWSIERDKHEAAGPAGGRHPRVPRERHA
jgi:hypothetical protein